METLTVLNLSGCKLVTFHVGTVKNLKELDLSKNMIRELLGTGLENLNNLQSFNISQNHISKPENLQVIFSELSPKILRKF
jgi:Leucine-rich repeat (LRR) protein